MRQLAEHQTQLLAQQEAQITEQQTHLQQQQQAQRQRQLLIEREIQHVTQQQQQQQLAETEMLVEQQRHYLESVPQDRGDGCDPAVQCGGGSIGRLMPTPPHTDGMLGGGCFSAEI